MVGPGYLNHEEDTGVSEVRTMSKDTNGGGHSNRPITGPEQANAKDRAGLTKEQWEALAANPEDENDLGYRIAEWEQFETLDGTDQMMFLPTDESELKDAAFVVAEDSAVVDLEKRC